MVKCVISVCICALVVYAYVFTILLSLTFSIFSTTLWHYQGGWKMQPGSEVLSPLYRGVYYKTVFTRTFACHMLPMSLPLQSSTWQFSAASWISQLQKGRGFGGKFLHQIWRNHNYSLLQVQSWYFMILTLKNIQQYKMSYHDAIICVYVCAYTINIL